MGKQYYISDKDVDLIVGLFEREIVGLEESIAYMEENKQWLSDPTMYDVDIAKRKQEIARLQKLGRRFGYDF